MNRNVFFAAALLAPFVSDAQAHEKGVIQIGVGASMGVHATHYEDSYKYSLLGQTVEVTHENDDGAATTTYPIDLQYGLADRFSLGLYVEPGSYIDSADNNPNSILLIGLSPRYYIVNNDHFYWYACLDLGAGALRISDKDETYTDTYAGGHFRLGSGVAWFFGDVFGVNLFAKYGAYALKWRDREPDPNVDNFEATLKTSGFHIGLGLQVKFGGS
jgi:hypothetical protein